MARVQVGGVSAPEALRTTLGPSLQMVQQRQDTTAGTQAAQLAEALGVGSKIASSLQKQYDDKEKVEAQKVLNSMTIDELGKKLKSGELAPNQSPLFMATLNGLYGENLRAKLERDTVEKMETGELQFNTPEELDKYITDARGSYLTETDKNAVKGFDTKFNQMRQSLLDVQGKLTASATVERMAGEATQFMLGEVESFRKENPNASDAEVAAQLMRLDSNVRELAPMPPKVQKQVLKNTMNELAARGEFSLLSEALKVKQPSGQTGATLIGADTARSLLSIAENNFDKKERQRVDGDMTTVFDQIRAGEFSEKAFKEYYKDPKNSKYVSAGAINSVFGMVDAQRRQSAAQNEKLLEEIELNRGLAGINMGINVAMQSASMGVPPEDLPESVTIGKQTVYPRKMLEERVNQTMSSRIASNQITPGQATAELTTLGVEYAPWKQLFNRGASLIDSGNFQMNGKPTEFNPKLAEAIDTYRQVYATSPSYAKKLAGGNSELFETMAFATSAGIPPEEAVLGFQNMKKFEGMDPTSRKSVEKIAGAVTDELLKPNWLMDFIPGVNQPSFTTSYTNRVRGLVDFYSKGYQGTAEEVKELVKQSLSANSVVMGGKAYMASDLPDFANSEATYRPALRERMLGLLAAQVKQERAMEDSPDLDLLEVRPQGDSLAVFYQGYPVSWRTQGSTKTGPIKFTKQELEKLVLERESDDAAAMAAAKNSPGNKLRERATQQFVNRLN